MSSCCVLKYQRVWRQWTWVCGAFIVAVASHATNATANQRATMSIGEVVGNNVYLRSGPSENHYVICKLNAGSRVTVVGDQGDWLEVLPPAGVFSLVAGEYVDTVDKKTGVVNADRVNIRAGSLLNGNKYTVQTKLAKGAEVRIVGENPDGFLRIEPPSNATVWITRQYVEMVPDSGLGVTPGDPNTAQVNPVDLGPPVISDDTTIFDNSTPEPSGLDNSAPQSSTGGEYIALLDHDADAGFSRSPDQNAGDTPSGASSIELDPQPLSPFYMMEATPHRVEIEKVDAALKAEQEKPLLQRDLEPIVARYRVLADQQEDEVARRYAESRLSQLENMADLRIAVKKLRELDGRAEAVRRRFLSERAGLMEPQPTAPVALDAKGELRASAVFQGTAGPRRFRLVDPSVSPARTIGFVEIPLDATYDVNDYLGRYIGVRAGATKLLADGVNPMPVYVASELVALDAPSRFNDAAAATQPNGNRANGNRANGNRAAKSRIP